MASDFSNPELRKIGTHLAALDYVVGITLAHVWRSQSITPEMGARLRAKIISNLGVQPLVITSDPLTSDALSGAITEEIDRILRGVQKLLEGTTST